MMTIRHGLAAGMMIVMLGVTAPAGAQESAPTPAAPSAPAASPEARAVIDRARAAYRAARTYQDKVTLRFEMRAKDADGNDRNEDDTEEMTFAFDRPGKFLFRHSDFAIYSDGAAQTGHSTDTGRYVQKPTTDGLVDEVRMNDIDLICAVHIPASLLISPTRFEREFPLFTEFTDVKPEALNGKPGKRISGKGSLPGMPFEAPIAMTMWFADSDGMLGELTMDLKPIYDMMDETLTIERATGTISFTNPVIGAPIPPETFVFKPGAADIRVETLVEEAESDAQLALVGQPAPEFKGVDLDGKPFALSDFKDKIVLLDFWAAICPACMQTLPKIQELAAEYDGKVVILGINEDDDSAREVVRRVAASRKLTFRQFMDAEGAVAASYFVESIPCMVLIDAKGVVRWVHTGATPTLKRQIAERIDTLLKDESSDTPPAKK